MEVAYRYNYINLPVLVKLKVLGELRVQAGPQIGFFIDGTSEVIKSSSGDFEGNTSDFEAGNNLDYGANLGLSYHFTDRFFVEGVYYHGLANITEGSGIDNKQHFFQLNLAYVIL